MGEVRDGEIPAPTEPPAEPEAGAEAPREAPLTRSLAELLADPDALNPPEPVIPRLAYRGRVTLLAAREKAGKSTVFTARAPLCECPRAALPLALNEETTLLRCHGFRT